MLPWRELFGYASESNPGRDFSGRKYCTHTQDMSIQIPLVYINLPHKLSSICRSVRTRTPSVINILGSHQILVSIACLLKSSALDSWNMFIDSNTTSLNKHANYAMYKAVCTCPCNCFKLAADTMLIGNWLMHVLFSSSTKCHHQLFQRSNFNPPAGWQGLQQCCACSEWPVLGTKSTQYSQRGHPSHPLIMQSVLVHCLAINCVTDTRKWTLQRGGFAVCNLSLLSG